MKSIVKKKKFMYNKKWTPQINPIDKIKEGEKR